MRAILLADPHKGHGYGILELSGIIEPEDPVLLVRRMSDGKTLSGGTWRAGDLSLENVTWVFADNALRINLGPSVIDNLSPLDEYQVTLTGFGTCALDCAQLYQSYVIDDAGAGLTPPMPGSHAAEIEDASFDNTVYENVESTPGVTPAGESGMPDGVAYVPGAKIDKPPRRSGCIAGFIILFALWLGGAFALWHGAMNTPPTTGQEQSPAFEIIPRSEDSTTPEDAGENAGRSR